MSKEAKEQAAMTMEQVTKMLNDPAVLQLAIAKAQQMGVGPSQPKAEPREPDELKEPEVPEITDEDTKETVNKKYAAYNKALTAYSKKSLARELDKFKKEQRDISEGEQAKKVKTFMSDPKRKAHFDDPEFFKEVDAQFRSTGDIETAYDKALKITGKGAVEPKKDKKPSASPEGSPSLTAPSTSDSDDTEEVQEKGFKNTREAAKAALGKALAETPDAENAINGGEVE